MAADARAIDDAVAKLVQRLECELQTYQPKQSPQSRPGPQRHLFPTGPYALGLWYPGDDVHLICLTDNSSNTFWEYIAEKLEREDLPKYDCIISDSGTEADVWLHYCSIPAYFDLGTVEAYGFPGFPNTARQQSYIIQNLAQLQDTWHLINGLNEHIDVFRDAYRFLRSWADDAGILSKAFGMLSSETLTWMLFQAETESTSKQLQKRSPSPGGVSSFGQRYHDSDNLQEVVTPNGRKAYAPLPYLEPASTFIAEEVGRLCEAPEVLERSREEHYKAFCQMYTTLMLVTAECWMPKKRADFHNQLVRAISHVPERLFGSGRVNDAVRIWPHPFKPSDEEWVYVVGVERSTRERPSQRLPPNSEMVELVESLEIDVDSSTGRTATNACSSKDALDLFGLHTKQSIVLPQDTKHAMPDSPSTPSSSPSASAKFPAASQVLSRLRWHPVHAAHDYEVGYLDRFEGLMWLPLEKWGKATEEEDFVPEHRIRVFRRVGEGGLRETVWDREARVCQLDGRRQLAI